MKMSPSTNANIPRSLKTTAQGNKNTASTSKMMKRQSENVEANVELYPSRALGILAAFIGHDLLRRDLGRPYQAGGNERHAHECKTGDQQQQNTEEFSHFPAFGWSCPFNLSTQP